MSRLKRFLGLETPKPSDKSTGFPDAGELPLSLSLGRMICLDRSLKLLLAGETDLVVPDDEKIWAIGTVELGQAKRLVRIYLDNEDYYVLFVMDGPRADDIEEIILFGYHEVHTVASKSELLRLVGPGSKIGLPHYELEGAQYTRQWGDEDGQTEMTPMTEQVVNADKSYSVSHNSILYARDLGLTNRREFLFFSTEEDQEGNVSLSTAVGVTLQITDIKVL
ncbi:MAG: DUF2491 family protein [Pseudomonas sp.]